MEITLYVLIPFFLSLMLSGIIIPQILLIAFRKRLFDKTEARKIHKSAVPRLGGIAFVPVILFSTAFVLGVSVMMNVYDMLELIINQTNVWNFGFCSILLLYVVGMADDLVGVRYRAKFVVQAISAIMVIVGGLCVNTFDGLFFINNLPLWLTWIVSIIVFVFITNAINLIDGIDGLASGLSGVAFAFYTILFFVKGEYAYSVVSISALAVLIQFFYYNVFGNAAKRTKIFMGDTGSLTIGVLLCIISFKILDGDGHYFGCDLNAFVLAFSPLVIPCFDVLRVYFYRIRHGRSPFLPDQNHIHHRIMALGWSQRRTMVTILASSVFITVMNVVLSLFININIILIIDFALWLACVYTITLRLRALGVSTEPEIHEPADS